MQAFGLHATDEEYDALFSTLDGDNSGEMDIGEIKSALLSLQVRAMGGECRLSPLPPTPTPGAGPCSHTFGVTGHQNGK